MNNRPITITLEDVIYGNTSYNIVIEAEGSMDANGDDPFLYPVIDRVNIISITKDVDGKDVIVDYGDEENEFLYESLLELITRDQDYVDEIENQVEAFHAPMEDYDEPPEFLNESDY